MLIPERTHVQITALSQFHGTDRSIDRFHEDLWSIRTSGGGRRLQTTRIRRTRDATRPTRKATRQLGSCFLREENVRHGFLFHSTHASFPPPPPSALYTPLFLSRSTTFLLIHLLRDPPLSPPPFLVE